MHLEEGTYISLESVMNVEQRLEVFASMQKHTNALHANEDWMRAVGGHFLQESVQPFAAHYRKLFTAAINDKCAFMPA